MSFSLTKHQQLSVDKLKECYLGDKRKIYFQAPTGSGKTLMISSLIDEIISTRPDKKIIFFFSTISFGNLNGQNFEKLTKYKEENNFKYHVQEIKSPSEKSDSKKHDYNFQIELQNRTVYCIGNATYGNKRIYKDQRILDGFIADAKLGGYEIVYIRDEAHIGNNVDKSGSENLLHLFDQDQNAAKIFFISATLEASTKMKPDVLFSVRDAESDHLIKASFIANDGISRGGLTDELSTEEFIQIAVNKFREVKAEYARSKNPRIREINPALLIQINSDNKTKDQYQEQKNREVLSKIIQILEDRSNGQKELRWLKYTSEGLESNIDQLNGKKMTTEIRNLLTRKDSKVDVIIFKVALATGWDIPRACMLLQVRDIYSKILDWQTIGRIRRNPVMRLNPDDVEKMFYDDLTDKYWIYSNVKKYAENLGKIPLVLKPEYCGISFDKVICRPQSGEKLSTAKIHEQIWNEINDMADKIIGLTTYRQTLGDDKRDKIVDDYLEENVDGKKNLVKMEKEVCNWFELYFLFKKTLGNRFTEIGKIVFDVINQFAEEHHLNANYVMLTLLDKENQALLQNLLSNYDSFKNSEFKYEVEKNKIYLPLKTYTSSDSENAVKILINDREYPIQSYAYNFDEDDLNENKNKKILFLDSDNEKIFFEEMRSFAKKTGEKTLSLYTKNYLENSNLCFEYKLHDKNDRFSISRSYPDFLFRYEDQWFFIEIKSMDEDDYDPQKTESLIEAYKEFSKLTDYTFAVVKINHKNQNWKFSIDMSTHGKSTQYESDTFGFKSLIEKIIETNRFLKQEGI